MAEPEAKLRKVGGVAIETIPAALSFQPQANFDPLAADDTDGKGKARWYSACLWCLPQGLKQQVLRLLQRRGLDMACLSMYALIVVIGHAVTFAVLLQPVEAPLVQVLRPAFITTSCLFNLSWLGVIIHGPGRLPSKSSSTDHADVLATQLAPALASTLEVGRFFLKRPFGAENGFCERCNKVKPPLVHHCSRCDQCSIWMDHHCRFTGQCIGFRNLRCFMVWLGYGTVLVWILAALTLHRVCWDGWPQDVWWLLWLPWFRYIWLAAGHISVQMQHIMLQLAAGWPSQIMRRKFEAVFEGAGKLEQRLRMFLAALPRGGPSESPDVIALQSVSDELSRVAAALKSGAKLQLGPAPTDLLWGPFLSGTARENIIAVFGAPPSWRWLVPCMPGGSGDPLEPATHSSHGCNAWNALAVAVERGREVAARCEQAACESERRFQTLLEGASAQGNKA